MIRRVEIQKFTLLTVLLVLFAALPALAQYNINVTVNDGGTTSA